MLDVDAVVLGVDALAAAVAVVLVVDLVVVLAVLVSLAAAVAVVATLVSLAAVSLAVVVAVLAVFAPAAMHPVMSIMPATLAEPATRRARRAGWGRRRLRAGGLAGVVFIFDSFAAPHATTSMESMIGSEPQSLLRTAWVVPPTFNGGGSPWATPSGRVGRRGRP